MAGRTRRAFGRARAFARRGRGRRSSQGRFGAAVDGGLAVVVNRFAQGVPGVGQFSRPLSLAAVGMYRNNDTLMTLAGVAAADQLMSGVQGLPGVGNAALLG